MPDLNIVSISTLFPNPLLPRHGIFLQHRLRHLARLPGVALKIVAPTPWFPFSSTWFGRYGVYGRIPRNGELEGVEVIYPRYPTIPRVGMTVAPLLMASALVPRLVDFRKHGFDFDIIDSYYLYPDGVAATMLGKLLCRPVVLTAFGTDLNLLPKYPLVRAQISWALEKAAAITAVCGALKKAAQDLGVPGDKIKVVLHGVDLKLFKPLANRPGKRRALGFTRPTLISVGHLIARKRNDVLLDALKALPGVDLVIAGDGPEEDHLKLLSERNGLDDRVRFLGHVDQAELVDLLGAADALVLCSDREGIANVIMEAMACGTPVAVTPVWGAPEVIDRPEAGLLFADCGPTAIADGIRRLLANLPDRAATRRYAENFAWSETAERHASLLAEVLARHRPRAKLEISRAPQ